MSEQGEERPGALDAVVDEQWERRRSDSGIIGRIAGAVTHAPSSTDLANLSDDLFAVVDALDSSVALRRALTDPGADEQRRQQLVHTLLDGKVSRVAVDVVAAAAGLRWAGGRVLTAALERQAVRSALREADEAGQLEESEDELFRFARLVDSDPALRDALADRRVPVARQQELVRRLLEGRATPTTVNLAARAVAARDRSFAHTIEGFVTLAAAQKNRVVATVRVARPLTPEQRERLRVALRRQVGREVALQEVVEESLLGGVRVELGDEVFEGTVAGRLEAARRMFD